MSFTIKIKEEITYQQFSVLEDFFELTALLHFGCELEKNHDKTLLWFITKNLKIARRFLTLIKNFYPNTNSFLMTSKEYNLPHLKSIYIGIEKDIPLILQKHNVLLKSPNFISQLKKNAKAKKAYLRGSFLCIGHVNDPQKSSYHLELFNKNINKIKLIHKLMLDFKLNAKQIKYKKGFSVYLKESQMIIDFLRLVGALEMVFQYEKTTIQKDFNQIIKSTINLEIANEKKILATSNIQLQHIHLIEKNLKTIKPKLLQIISLRKKNPDSSLKELAQKYYHKYQHKITKSGLNYCFQNIQKLAQKIQEDKE